MEKLDYNLLNYMAGIQSDEDSDDDFDGYVDDTTPPLDEDSTGAPLLPGPAEDDLSPRRSPPVSPTHRPTLRSPTPPTN